jgi:diguanylate cyclase (GGDEF)-like protein
MTVAPASSTCTAHSTSGANEARRQPVRALVVGRDTAMAAAITGCCCALEMQVHTLFDADAASLALSEEEAELLLVDAALGDEAVVRLVHRVRVALAIDVVPIVVGGDARQLRAMLKEKAPGMVDRVLDFPFDHDELHECLSACRRTIALQRGWRSTLDHVTEAVVVIDDAGRVRTFNAAAQRLFQWRGSEMRGQHVGRLMPSRHRNRHDAYVERYLRGGVPHVIGTGRVEEGLRRDGTCFPMHLSVDDISDSSGVRFVGVIRDLSPERERDELRERALHDPLTALPNRAHALQRLQQACKDATNAGLPFALLYVDLDRFKPINDSLGHQAGDAVLTAVAQRMRRALAARDFVARLGGDEFLVLLIGIDQAPQARAVAERLRAVLTQPLSIGDRRVTIDASFGVALWGVDGHDATALIAAADRAMYRAKQSGRCSCPPSESGRA